MEQSNQGKMHMLKEGFMDVEAWIMEHRKIVMPLVLIVCVLITVAIAINVNHRDALEKEAELAAAVAGQEEEVSVEGISMPVFELEENAYPEVNHAVRSYYDAQAAGDVGTVSAMNVYLNDIEKIHVEVMSHYIESYPVVDVYTKPGLSENTYVAYVYSEVKFADVEQEFPGMQTYYIGQDEKGNFFINAGTYDDTVWKYITEVTLQDDVVDLNNKVVVAYNELLAEDEELNEYIAYLKDKINEEVGEILAKAEAKEAEELAGEEETGTETASAEKEGAVTVVQTVKATDVVNIRTSDSETADKIDKAQIGQEFKLLEQRGNGWSKIEYNGREAYIKSDYLETASEVTLTPNTGNNDVQQAAAASNDTVTGTITVKETVRIRKSASTDSQALGTVYQGDKLELVMKQADGWTKIKYQGETAFVKSDYVE